MPLARGKAKEKENLGHVTTAASQDTWPKSADHHPKEVEKAVIKEDRKEEEKEKEE